METIKKYAYLIIAIIFIVLLGYLSLLKDQRDNARTSLDLAKKSVEQLQAHIEKTNQQLKTIQQIDKEYQEKLQHAKIENDRLRDDLVNNVKRVYVKADCPALPDNAAATSGINATTAQLTGNARQDYLRLRLEIGQVTNQVKGLQDYIRNVCQK